VVGSPATLLDLGNIFRSENQSLAREYTITATNNGPDTYTIGATGAGDANTENNTAPFTFNSKVDGTGDVLTNNVVLGASALAVGAANGALTIIIPSDGDASAGALGASSVNGLETDTVLIGTDTYVLGTVTDTGTGNITIGLTQVGTATGLTGAVVAGVSVFEVKSVFILNADVGDRVDPLVSAVVTVTTTLDGLLSNPTTPDTFLITIVRVTINKYVRNIDVGAPGGCTGTCTAVSSSGVDYFAAGTGDTVVKANSGEKLQYLVRVNVPNEDGANLTVANIADILPAFTQYVCGSTLLNNKTVANDPAAACTFPLAGAGLPIDDDAGRAAGAVASGDVAKNATVDIVYQVELL